MQYLLDTHVLIYLGCGDTDRIGKRALQIYRNRNSRIFASQISFWEMAIKCDIGKLHIPIGLRNVVTLLRQAGIETMPVRNAHIFLYESLERKEEHKDPFDRYLVATAQCENLTIVSADEKFDLYSSTVRIWE